MGCYSLHTKHFLANNNFGVLVVFNIMTFFVPFLAKQKVQIFVFCSATKSIVWRLLESPAYLFSFAALKQDCQIIHLAFYLDCERAQSP